VKSDDVQSGARGEGEQALDQEILAELYRELRAAAQSHIHRTDNHDLMGATTLVHEVVVKLNPQRLRGMDKVHVWRLAGRAMQQVVIDRARERDALKRGGAVRRVTMDDVDVPDMKPGMDAAGLEMITRALEEVAAGGGEGNDAAEVFRLRFFAGMTHEQAARALGMSESSVRRLLLYARASIRRVIETRGWTDGA
jgi:RNA polymerase sigma factor (TIGR02999 family)